MKISSWKLTFLRKSVKIKEKPKRLKLLGKNSKRLEKIKDLNTDKWDEWKRWINRELKDSKHQKECKSKKKMEIKTKQQRSVKDSRVIWCERKTWAEGNKKRMIQRWKIKSDEGGRGGVLLTLVVFLGARSGPATSPNEHLRERVECVWSVFRCSGKECVQILFFLSACVCVYMSWRCVYAAYSQGSNCFMWWPRVQLDTREVWYGS